MLLIHGDNERFRDLPEEPHMTPQKRLLLGGAAIVFLGTIELATGAPASGVALEAIGVGFLAVSEITEYFGL
jgi:hypothetical protein